MIGNIDIDSNDLQYHRNIGKQLQKNYSRISTSKVTDEFGYYRPSQFSGVVILIQKKIWKQIGGFKESGFIGVDDDLRSNNALNTKLHLQLWIYLCLPLVQT